MFRSLRNALAALLLVSSPILAAIPAAAQDPGDPPADVARIAVISGSVSSHQPGSQNWDAAQQNYPLAPGSGVWTEPRSHAAVDVAGARVHLDASSQLEITAINPGQVQLDLASGAAVIRVYPGVSGVNFQIDTAHGSATINQPGQYEIVAGDDQNPASVSVIEGQAQFAAQNANLALQAGQRGTITPNGQSAVDAAQPDDFVRMVQGEEQPYQQQVAQTAQYVSPQQTGYQDLARYGQWDQAAEYGAVWYPQAVPANWAPYRYGHWAYVAPWGWTWVDDQPWGFTPFHYGRWVEVGHRWGWVPGRRVERPVYAPALVSFFDLGGVGVGLSLGWVPLGPDEVFVPSYRHSPRYVREVNITNVRNETTIVNVVNKKTVINVNNYKNFRGATSASRDVMARGGAVAPDWNKNGKAKSDEQWAHAKPDQEVAFKPQNAAQPGKGPKFNPQTQRQNGQPGVNPNGKQAEPNMPVPQAQTDKNLNKNGQPNKNKVPMPSAQVNQSQKATGKPNNPNPPQSPSQISKGNGKPNIPNPPKAQSRPQSPKDLKNNAKPVAPNQPLIPLPPGQQGNNGSKDRTMGSNAAKLQAPAAANIPAPPKSSRNQQPAVSPAAIPQPPAQPQRQEQVSKKAQQEKPQAQRKAEVQQQKRFVQPQVQPSSKQPRQEQQPNNARNLEKAPRANQAPAQQQQHKKPVQNCGQQPEACQ